MRTGLLPNAIVAALTAALIASTAAFAARGSARVLYFDVKSPVPRGKLAHVSVQGLLGLCRIRVSKGGREMRIRPLRINPLRPKLSTAARDGRIAWQWWVPVTTPLGLWHVRVNCGHAPTLNKVFLVTR